MKIIHEVKLVDYLNVQADNAWYNYCMPNVFASLQHVKLQINVRIFVTIWQIVIFTWQIYVSSNSMLRTTTFLKLFVVRFIQVPTSSWVCLRCLSNWYTTCVSCWFANLNGFVLYLFFAKKQQHNISIFLIKSLCYCLYILFRQTKGKLISLEYLTGHYIFWGDLYLMP